MAFAPIGSRPKPASGKGEHHPLSATNSLSSFSPRPHPALEDNRLPAIIAAPIPPHRERVVRKPPVPRGLSKPNPPVPKPVKRVGVVLPAASADRRKQRPAAKATVKNPLASKSQPSVPPRANSKPALPPKRNANPTHIAPDSLIISAQLAPWLYMRSSLEPQLKQLEIETEDILKAEREKLLNVEEQVEEHRLRVDLSGQEEMLEDLCEESNSEFSSSLSLITRDLFSFLSNPDNPSSTSAMNATLESLQDKVHSSEWAEGALEKIGTELDATLQQGQAILDRLNGVSEAIRDTKHASHPTLKHPERWKTTLERLASLLELRLRNLQVLRGAVSSVVRYQKRHIELQVMNVGLS